MVSENKKINNYFFKFNELSIDFYQTNREFHTQFAYMKTENNNGIMFYPSDNKIHVIPSRAVRYLTAPSQTRTSIFLASGSSQIGFAD